MSSVWCERVLHVCVLCGLFMSSVWLNVFFMCVCVDVHVQRLVERVLHVCVCLCGCSCPVFG